MTQNDKDLIEAVNKVIVVTMDNVPNKNIVEVVGLVELPSRLLTTKETEVSLKKLAYEMGANAVVGVKVYSYGASATSPTYYGTAVIVE